jgi:hypothetical protein
MRACPRSSTRSPFSCAPNTRRASPISRERSRASTGSRFTEQELKDVLAFFKTPAGRKYLGEKPRLLDETSWRLQQWQSRVAEDIMIKVRAEMRKRGHNLE